MNSHAQLDWVNGQPVSLAYDDVYFSRDSGLDETRHVFLVHNQLAERFAALPEHGQFCIGETGFGTGLNFLCAWECFEQNAPATARLHFVSAEKFPLTRPDLARALALWPELASYAALLLQQYDVLSPGWHRLLLADGRITLTLMIGDILDVLPELDARIDAWFLDGFAPSKNPDMWQQSVYEQMARLSAPAASYATFTSAGHVRRGLMAAGFSAKRIPGHGGKRHITQGQLLTPVKQDWTPPWFARPDAVKTERSAIVVGGGIAGASTAASLARRGWQVTIVERLPKLAAAASGNPQGVLYTKLSPHLTPLTRLVLSGYAHTLRTLHANLPQDEQTWQACGVLQLAQNAKEAGRQQALAQLDLPDSVLKVVDQQQASEIAGVAMPGGGLYFAQGGWVNPPALVAHLVDHPNICVRTSRSVLELSHDDFEQTWVAHDETGPVAIGSVVILAGAAETANFDATSHLPLKRIRGQITVVPATPASQALRTVVCGEGYVSPARFNQHCMGATFKFNADDLQVKPDEHQENLQMLASMAPALHQAIHAEQLAENELSGRAAYRCTSPDYMPLIGPVADKTDLIREYLPLSKDATLQPEQAAPWVKGLYVNTAHGSRGLITAPLSGEILAAILEGEPAPLPRSLMQAIHPNRFLMRDLIRQKLNQETP